MKKVELLAPAGGIKQYIAAVENGADAIYLGGSLYNARMNASNFTLKELEEVLDYGHLRNVKTYVTMNTLLTDEELKDALSYAGKLYAMGVDALIIQDIGLASAIHESYPDFPLHLSTQATVYNVEGVKKAKELGFSRVVFARELSLEEIAKSQGILETEVFIHGALCFCYSGQCQLSRYIGGRSGNKGGCAQPCRLPYLGGEGDYPLSPKDLNMIDHIGELISMGVSSFKIEGRMKSPEYVATVVRVYRKYIDLYLKNGKYEVTKEDRLELMQIFNRGGFTEGYAKEDPNEELLSGMMPKNQGVFVGRVDKPFKNGLLADIDFESPVKMGDVIEIHNENTFSTKVTYLEKLSNGLFRVGDMKDKVYNGDKVFKIVSVDLMKKAEETFENGKSLKKIPLDLTFFSKIGEKIKLSVVGIFDGKKVSITKESDFEIQEAKNRGTTEEDIYAQLSKMGGTPFEVGKLKTIMDESCFIPQSKLNEIRRDAVNELIDKVKLSFRREELEGRFETKEYTSSKRFEYYFYSFEDFRNANFSYLIKKGRESNATKEEIRYLLPIRDVLENINEIELLKGDISVIPYISNVGKGNLDIYIKEERDRIVKAIKHLSGEVYLGNLSYLDLFKDRDIDIYYDFGINVYNMKGREKMLSLGFKDGIESLEAITKANGPYPLMITEHRMPESVLTDRKSAKYRVRFDSFNHKSVITSNDETISWDEVKEEYMNKTTRIYIGGKNDDY